MPLTPGTKLGPYEVLTPAGAGGMGEVYRARDTRLDRTVALKVLSARLADRPDLQKRFEREARTISKLSHPHICTLHDVGQQEGVDFLVMEYLEGETLGHRLQRGPLSLEQTLKYGVEIAAALETAHRQGIVHRDLKPANIMLTKAGTKLMDFGLAKLAEQPVPVAVALSEMADAPTLPSKEKSLTEEGVIVGTFQYMAPEQLEGRDADARTDIFALGMVLYEMATGRPAFTGKTKASVIAAILSSEPPPISSLQPLTPPAFDRVVKTCLAKDPEERFSTAHDVELQLKWIAEGGSQAGVPIPVVARRKSRERLAWAVAGAALASLAVVLAHFLTASRPTIVIHAQIPPPEKAAFAFSGDRGGPPVLSPDGRRLVFVAYAPDSPRALWVRSLDSNTALRLDGTEGAYFPFWSADSHFLGFFSEGKLKKVSATGGPVTTLADALNGRGGSWGRDDVILYSPDFYEAVYRIGAAGGHPARVTTLNPAKHTTHRWPFFLADGTHCLYFATNHSGGAREQNGIYFASLDGKEDKFLVANDVNGQYASGYLLFQSQAGLVAQPFDPSRGELSGEPVPVADKVQADSGLWRTMFTVSENGVLAYQSRSARPGSELMWFDRTGKQVGKVGERGPYTDPRLSPDGRHLAVSLGDRLPSIWVFDLERGTKTRLTFDDATHLASAWSPDGSGVAFTVRSGTAGTASGFAVHRRASNGTGANELVLAPVPGIELDYLDWSPDGHYLLYERAEGTTGRALWAVPLSGDKKPFPLVQPQSPKGIVASGRFSPDGRWIAYSARDSGRPEVYVASFPGPGGRWQLSTNGGTFPSWRRDGKEIYYHATDTTTLTAVEVSTKGSEFQVGTTRPLFRLNSTGRGAGYDVSPDGQRFLVNDLPEEPSTPITLVVNWTARIKR